MFLPPLVREVCAGFWRLNLDPVLVSLCWPSRPARTMGEVSRVQNRGKEGCFQVGADCKADWAREGGLAVEAQAKA